MKSTVALVLALFPLAALTGCSRKAEPTVEPVSQTRVTGAQVDTTAQDRPAAPPPVTPQDMAAAPAPGPVPTYAVPGIVDDSTPGNRSRYGSVSTVAVPPENLGLPAAGQPQAQGQTAGTGQAMGSQQQDPQPRVIVAPTAPTPTTAPRVPSAGDANPWTGASQPTP